MPAILPADRNLRVFLVEDSPLLRKRLRSMVSDEPDLEIIGQAAGESEAISKLASTATDVIVVDLQLKPGNGIAVIRAARAHASEIGDTHPVWIVVLTNLNLPTVRERCEAAGANFFLDKMQDIEQLIPVLRGLARSRCGNS